MKYAPKTVVIDQTVLCDQECSFCWRSDRELVRRETQAAPFHTMPFEVFSRIVDEAAAIPTIINASLCGPMGEPALVKDLVARGRYLMSKRFAGWVVINSNGHALDRHDPRELLRAFTAIHVSVDSIEPETYAKIHGRGRHLEKVIANIFALVEARKRYGGATIKVRFTENEHNARQWRKFSRFFRPHVSLIHRRVHAFVDVVEGAQYQYGAQHCNQPKETVNFNYRGEMTTCCINYKLSPTFGKLGEGRSLQELWEGREFERWRGTRLEGLCKDCSGLGPHVQKVNVIRKEAA